MQGDTGAQAMAKKLRVLLVSPVGEHGGAEQVFLSLAKYLPQWDVEPILVCMRPGPLVEMAHKQGLPTHVFQEHRYRQMNKVAQGGLWLARLARRERADLIHGNHAAHIYSGPAAMLSGRPEIWHIHDYPYQTDGLNRLMERLPSRYVLFTTRRVESGYPKLHRRRHSVVYPVCVEPERLRGIVSHKDVRARFGFQDGPLFLTVARLQEHKGHRYLIAAIPEILAACPEAQFAIPGRAAGAEQEAYRCELESACATLGVTDRVRFLGYVCEEDLIGLYREATALVHPALSEGYGLTLLEAMALGTPVLAAAADGPREIIEEGKTGRLFPPADSAALAKCVIEFLQDPAAAATYRREATAFIDRVQIEKMTEQTVEIYRELCPL